MRRLALLALCLAWPAAALDDIYEIAQVLPPPPNGDHGIAVVDYGDLVIARIRDEAYSGQLDQSALDRVVRQALASRTQRYDFVVVSHSSRLPHEFQAGAFHRAYNNDELRGVGSRSTLSPTVPTRSVLWMNSVTHWTYFRGEYPDWVFAHEMSHYWLARPRLPGGSGALLGRQNAHWSYFVNTTNSPIEGNAWIDNGDGTFTTDIGFESSFSMLDLYLMGFVGPDEVPDSFYIEGVDEPDLERASPPDHIYGSGPTTVRGNRVNFSIEDIIEANGERQPSVADSPKHFRLLPVFIVKPDGRLREPDLAQMRMLTERWTTAWSHYTGERSTCEFTIAEDRSIPEMGEPIAIPKGAW